MNQSAASFAALGSLAVVAASSDAALRRALPAVHATIEEFDLACSRFRDDSELSAVNRSAGRYVEISELLSDALEHALRAARLTEGDVDPTVGSALIALGYDRDFESISGQGRVTFAAVPGWQKVKLDAAGRRVRIPQGVKLDLGATAKALAADHAARRAAAAAGPRAGVLVSLGGDIATAGPAPAGGWRVRVTDDHRAGTEAPGQWISIQSGGLATSSTAVRRWRIDGGEANHIVDPRSGRSADGPWRTVSVTAGTCVDANTASTAAILRGESAPAWLESVGLPSRLVSQAGEVRHVHGWPREGDELA